MTENDFLSSFNIRDSILSHIPGRFRRQSRQPGPGIAHGQFRAGQCRGDAEHAREMGDRVRPIGTAVGARQADARHVGLPTHLGDLADAFAHQGRWVNRALARDNQLSRA